MSKSFQNTRVLSLVFGATAFAALAFAAPAAAQGVPDALRRLDSPQVFNAQASAAELQQPRVRNSYARVRKHNEHHVAAQ
jgi:transcriptional regulator of nitric oxide reductase